MLPRKRKEPTPGQKRTLFGIFVGILVAISSLFTKSQWDDTYGDK